MFFKHTIEEKVAILLVYVDDIIITRNDEVEIQKLKLFLNWQFEIKDLGSLRYFLGMKIAHSSKGITVSQRKYTLDLLKKVSILGWKSSEIPINSNHKIGEFKDLRDTN